MTKQEFLAMSFPFGLKVDIIYNFSSPSKSTNLIGQDLDKENEYEVIPYCRPLPDLANPIEHNGEKFVPIVELAKISWITEYVNFKFQSLKENLDNIKKENQTELSNSNLNIKDSTSNKLVLAEQRVKQAESKLDKSREDYNKLRQELGKTTRELQEAKSSIKRLENEKHSLEEYIKNIKTSKSVA